MFLLSLLIYLPICIFRINFESHVAARKNKLQKRWHEWTFNWSADNFACEMQKPFNCRRSSGDSSYFELTKLAVNSVLPLALLVELKMKIQVCGRPRVSPVSSLPNIAKVRCALFGALIHAVNTRIPWPLITTILICNNSNCARKTLSKWLIF